VQVIFEKHWRALFYSQICPFFLANKYVYMYSCMCICIRVCVYVFVYIHILCTCMQEYFLYMKYGYSYVCVYRLNMYSPHQSSCMRTGGAS